SCAPVDSEKLNIHIVPHSHNDLGGKKTTEQYYYGTRNDVQNAGVQYIFDTVVQSLEDNADRKFIIVETGYFWKWWMEQDEAKQLQVKTMVNDGRLEFVGGAWSMNDEATTHYYSIIDQFTWGLKRLNDTFGECGRPRVGWQIDTFGHSRVMASIFAEMGYDGLIIGRIDHSDKAERLSAKTAEMVWQGSPVFGASADIFTTVLSGTYEAPSGFCFDIVNCEDEPIIDNQNSPDYNVNERINDFIEYANAQKEYYNTNNILIPMGGDFHYQEAQSYFSNLDKLVKYANANGSVNVIYSTPSCYLKAVNDAGFTFTTKQDDFFPYASDENSYWTGFYTSRPTNKYFERLGNNLLQASKQLSSQTQRIRADPTRLNNMREGMGVMQNHQTITGTEKQNVADDYMRASTNTLEEGRLAGETSLNQLISLNDYVGVQTRSCLELNVSICWISESEKFVATVYNPLSHAVNHTVRVPVSTDVYPIGQSHQFLPIPESVLLLPEREGSAATYDLVFRAINIPPLGLRSYYIKRISDVFIPLLYTTETTIGDDDLQVNLDRQTGYVTSIVRNGVEFALDQKFYYYESFAGNNEEPANRSSGAHVFRPANPEPIQIGTTAYYEVYKGDIVDEIHQTINSWVRQVIRVYKEENYVEFEWLVGPIPVDDGIGKEVITRFTTDFDTNGLFYTDSNGRDMLERTRNSDISEPVSGNYYPVTSTILIRDTDKAQEFAILTDRAQGGSSLNDGQIELMLHRRLLNDDGFGIGESLDELEYSGGLVVRGKHTVMVGSTTGASPSFAAERRLTSTSKILGPWYFMTPTSVDFISWTNVHTMEFVGLNQDLPSNIVIHSLEPWDENSLLIRVEHIMGPDDDTELSQPVEINFEDIFSTFTVTSSRLTTLGGNQWTEDQNRLVWSSTDTRFYSYRELSFPKNLKAFNPLNDITTDIVDKEQIKPKF
ncbi:hypothetical protein L9F63_001514, partial [Diploptera punctata]